MNWLKRIVLKGLFGVDWGVAGADTYDSSIQWMKGAGRTPGAMDRPYTTVGPFHRVVSVISKDAAGVPLEFFAPDETGQPGEGDEPVPNHPIQQLWNNPNGHMVGQQLFIGSFVSKMVFGEWIWYYPDVKLGTRNSFASLQKNQGELLLLHPPSVIRKMVDGKRKYWLKQKSGAPIPLDEKFLTHSMRHNPYSQLVGLPLAASIIADLLGYHAAAEWNARFFNEQNGIPTILLMPGEKSIVGANEEDRQNFIRRFTQRNANRRTVAALPGGWTAKDFGVTQRDMDFPELRQFGRDEFLANAGVPPLVAGYLTRPITYNAKEQKQLYWQSTIHGFLTEECSIINEDFLPKMGVVERVFPKWEVVKALLEDVTEKAEQATKLFAMGFTRRQINDRLELGFDVDKMVDADVSYLPFNLSPVTLLLNPPPPPELPGGDAEGVEEGDDESNGESKAARAQLREAERTVRWKRLINQARDIESRFNSVIRAHMQSIQKEVLDNLEGVKGWLARTKDHDPFEMFDLLAADKSLVGVTKPLHVQALKRGGEQVLLEIGTGIDFNMNDATAQRVLRQLSGKITGINETIRQQLGSSLSEGFGLGESPGQLATRVREAMKVSKARSQLIARTETGFAHSTGRDVGMKQAGVEKHEWLSARDARVRPTHKAADGQVVTIGQPFPGLGLTRPLDPNGRASEVANCRCVVVPVLENEDGN